MLKKLSFTPLVIVAVLGQVACNKETDSANNLVAPVIAASNNAPATASNEAANNTAPAADGNAPNGYGVKNPDRIFQTDTLAKTTIKTPGGDLVLWIMDNEDKRREGMMFLHDNEVKDNEGMIFVFPEVQKLSGNYAFWMQHTILPLDIDYISKDKKVLNIGKGVPQSEAPVKPTGDYFYVIEVKQGLSAKFGLTPGAKVAIPDTLKGLP